MSNTQNGQNQICSTKQKLRKVLFTNNSECFLALTDAIKKQIVKCCNDLQLETDSPDISMGNFFNELRTFSNVKVLYETDGENEMDRTIMRAIGWDEEYELSSINAPKIERMITLSTRHICKDTAEYISRQSDLSSSDIILFKKACADNDYGWFIYVPLGYMDSISNNKNIPSDLKVLMYYAAEQNCCWLCLDCDGEETVLLPLYKWKE